MKAKLCKSMLRKLANARHISLNISAHQLNRSTRSNTQSAKSKGCQNPTKVGWKLLKAKCDVRLMNIFSIHISICSKPNLLQSIHVSVRPVRCTAIKVLQRVLRLYFLFRNCSNRIYFVACWCSGIKNLSFQNGNISNILRVAQAWSILNSLALHFFLFWLYFLFVVCFCFLIFICGDDCASFSYFFFSPTVAHITWPTINFHCVNVLIMRATAMKLSFRNPTNPFALHHWNDACRFLYLIVYLIS